jgi:hypothetical protein
MFDILASYIIGNELYHYRENREETFLGVGYSYLKESEIWFEDVYVIHLAHDWV